MFGQHPRARTDGMNIRPEQPNDRAAIHALHVAAFGSPVEADIVDVLREQARPIVSLVADDNGEIVGHILCTPVTLEGHAERRIMGLAPLAVAPERQRQGIGSALVRNGLAWCRQLGYGAVVVLGHPSYYPRFGFRAAVTSAIGCEFEAPPEAFMLLELQTDYLRGCAGTIRFHPAFSAA